MKSLLMVLVLFAASVAQAGDWSGQELTLMENANIQDLYEAQTKHRNRNGLRPQTLNGELCRAAQEWSEYMAKWGHFSHSHYPVAENIAVGQKSANSAMNGWINSRGHNANLLSGYEQVGFGIAESADGTRYWTSCHGSGFKVHKGG
jgi:uncharacterized protein YkwD